MASVFLYVPNLIGYLRMAIVAYAWLLVTDDRLFALLFFVSVLLDGVDGWAARLLGQASAFGTLLDVSIDLGARAMLWSLVWPRFGGFISSIEWLGLLSNYREAGTDWKKDARHHPHWIRAIFANGFKNPWGAVLVTGTHFLPLAIFVYERGIWTASCAPYVIAFLWFGKGICFATEGYFIWYHVKKLNAS
ncbi:hypothetical protein HPB49_016997 [Dermacentor silvarum]|uniref:Uncharacterized protein n=1 Tax=Dermacentor silvarum TaxID=543639 RepID=A0ACB8CYN2_DERSI|nr:hypothetical protein HPB49_016997 [Dermacentor silvarum]